MNHREAFCKTKRYFGITGSALHRQTGVSNNHISEFIRGKGKISTDVLDRLVKGMIELEPEALPFYINALAGKKANGSVTSPKALVDKMDNEQMSELMFAIAAKMGSKSKNQLKNEQLALSH
ncbi:MAG: hypothetical protein AAFR77_12205 [Cyanobacteria bacterium J06631_2]